MTCKTAPFTFPNSVTEQKRREEMDGGVLLSIIAPLSDRPPMYKPGVGELIGFPANQDFTGRTAKGRARRS